MAEKSAHIDTTLRLAGLSEVFTQDLEDLSANVIINDAARDPPTPPAPSTGPASPSVSPSSSSSPKAFRI